MQLALVLTKTSSSSLGPAAAATTAASGVGLMSSLRGGAGQLIHKLRDTSKAVIQSVNAAGRGLDLVRDGIKNCDLLPCVKIFFYRSSYELVFKNSFFAILLRVLRNLVRLKKDLLTTGAFKGNAPVV